MKLKKNNWLLYFLLYYFGAIYLFYFLNRRKQRILNYHHILPDNVIENNLIFNYSHSISSFRSQLGLLTKRFTPTIKLKQKNGIMLTFDDGAINNFNYALPVLNEFNIKAYFFMLENQVRRKQLIW